MTVRADWIGDSSFEDGFSAPDFIAVARGGAAVVGQPFTVAGQPTAIDGDARVFRALLGLMGVAALAMAGWLVLLILTGQGTAGLLAAIGLVVIGAGTLAGRRLVTRYNVVRAVTATSLSIFALTLAVSVSDGAPTALLMANLVAVLIAVPYVDSRTLRRLAAAAWITSSLTGLIDWRLVGSGGAVRPANAGIEYIGGVVAVTIALLAVVHVHARLTSAVERYRMLFQRVPVGMYRTTLDGQFLEANGAFAAMFGITDPAQFADLDAASLYVDPNDRSKFRDEVERDGVAHAIDFRARAPGGRIFWLRDSALLVRDQMGEPLYYEGIVQDVTGRKFQELQLENRASLDGLTGLANRGVLVDALSAALTALPHNGPVALLFLDLNNFKQVNDLYGHAAGDEVLVETGSRLRHATRDADLVARYGGDEFAVLLKVPSGVHDAEAVAKRIVAACDAPFAVGSTQLRLGASVGIAVSDTRLSAQALIDRADSAMYAAKRRTNPPEIAEAVI